MKLIEAWLADLQETLTSESLSVTDVRIGVFYTAAQISTGEVGLAFTPRDATGRLCCPDPTVGGPPAGQMAGAEAWTLARYALSSLPLQRAVGVAVLNGLSAVALGWHGVPAGRLLAGVNALDAAGIAPDDRVAMVGAFPPFVRTLKNRVAHLAVIDKHKEALEPGDILLWRPPDLAAEILREASAVVITGSALVEGEIDELLEASSGARRVVLAGPTTPPWPKPLFTRGVHVLGGVRIRDGGKVLRIVGEGGAGHSLRADTEKICLVRDDAAGKTP